MLKKCLSVILIAAMLSGIISVFPLTTSAAVAGEPVGYTDSITEAEPEPFEAVSKGDKPEEYADTSVNQEPVEQEDFILTEEDVEALFHEVVCGAAGSDCTGFAEYPLYKRGAYEYYIEKYGYEEFGEMLAAEYKDSIIPPADADDDIALTGADNSGDYFDWSVSGTTLTISGSGALPDYEFYYVWLEKEPSPWHDYRETVTKVVINEGITSIGADNFYAFNKLTDLSLPSTLTSIGDSAFFDCSALVDLKLPSNLKEIESGAFSYCESIKSVTLPDKLRRMGTRVFDSCVSISYAYIGSGLKVIGGNPFSGCSALKDFTLSPNNRYLYISDHTLFDNDKILIGYPVGRDHMSTYTVPSGTVEISDSAFSTGSYGKKIFSKVIIPDSVISIGDGAFYEAGLTSVDLGSGVEEIGSTAFFNNPGITSLSLPDSLTRIGRDAFSLSEITSVNIPKNVKSVGRCVFSACRKLSKITVSSSNPYYKSVDGVLMTKDGKTLVTYPCGKTDSSYTVPDMVITLEMNSFELNNNLKKVTLPNGLRTIMWYSFSSCESLEEVVVPDSVVDIDTGCFNYCDKLKRATIGKGITRMNESFAYCDSLREIYFRGDLPEDYDMMLYSEITSQTVYYPKNNPTWKNGSIKLGYPFQKLAPWDGDNHIRYSIGSASISVKPESFTYDGLAKKPFVTVAYGGENLVEGKDYKVNYSDYYSAGTATATVQGIGNYEGTVNKTYTIQKAEQILSVPVSISTIKVGGFATIRASGAGTISYSSSNSSVASVDSSGLVTGNKQGSAVITVSASGNTNFNSAKKTVDITVVNASNNLSLNDLSFSFGNNKGAFGYSSNYSIPAESYEVIFPPERAEQLAETYKVWKGNCHGFSFTSAMFSVPGSGLKPSMFRSSATNPGDLKVTDRSSELGFDLTRMIEAGWSVQLTPLANKVRKNTRNDYKGFINEVKKCDNGGPPVEFGMIRFDSSGNYIGGHSILAYKYEYVDSTTQRVHVYDCNGPFEDRYITFKTDSAGNYKSWNFLDKYTDANGGYFDYVPYYYFQQIWDNRGTDYYDYTTSLAVANDNFELYDSSDELVAAMENGVLTSCSDYIYEAVVKEEDIDAKDHHLFMPVDKYTVVCKDNTYDNPLELTAMNKNQSASVVTESNQVEFLVDDSQNANLLNVKGKSGEKYDISFNSDSDDTSEYVYSGKSTGGVVEVGTVDGDYLDHGYTRSGIREDGTAINLQHMSNLNISDYTVDLPVKSFVFNGEPIEPDFTVKDKNGDPISPNCDYKVVYSNNVGSGTAHAEVFGINDYFGKLEFDFTIGSVSLNDCDVQLEYTESAATGERIEPGVTVSLNGTELVEGVHYSLIYAYNVRPGIAEARITAVNGCTGNVTATFRIKPNAVLPEFEYSLLEDGSAKITAYFGTSPNVVIPSEIDGHKVTAIGTAVFYRNQEVESVTLPDTVTSIGSYSFADTAKIKRVYLPDSVTEIQDYAFRHCKGIDFTKLPANLKKIGAVAFYDCGKTVGDIVLPSKLESIDIYAFHNTIYTGSVTIPPSVESISKYSFGYYASDGAMYRNTSFVIKGMADTAAQEYAEDYKFIFEEVSFTPILGDVDRDGSVMIVDATFILRKEAELRIPFEIVTAVADVDSDGSVTIEDASFIQLWLVKSDSNKNIGKPIDEK